jgi:hypothetical protein
VNEPCAFHNNNNYNNTHKKNTRTQIIRAEHFSLFQEKRKFKNANRNKTCIESLLIEIEGFKNKYIFNYYFDFGNDSF